MHHGVMDFIGFGARLEAGSAALTLDSVDYTTSTTTTITAPATINSGDLLVLIDYTYAFSAVTKVVPTGFTEIVDYGSGDFKNRYVASYKIADGTEDSSTITGMSGLGSLKALMRVVPSGAISTVTPASIASEYTILDPAAQVCTSGSGAVPLIVIGVYQANNPVSTRSFSPAADGEISNGTTFFVNYKIYNSSPADCTIDMADYGTNALASFYLEAA